MHKKVLITGATGLIGRELVRQCHEDGVAVHYLTTRKEKIETRDNYRGFYWNPETLEIDTKAFEGVSGIIHLVGATISKRWSKAYKKTILESRTKPTDLLFTTLQSIDHNVIHFISASGVGIYPNSKTKLYTEESQEVDITFLANVVVAWEAVADKFKQLGMEVSKVRTGMVLAKEGGALPQLIKPIKFGLGAALGSGGQWQSWIHLKDIAAIYLFIFKKQLEGVYNGVAPNPVVNKRMTRILAAKHHSSVWLPNIPSFLIKLVLGEMSVLVLEGQLVSSHKLEELGFHFEFYCLEAALEDLL